MCLIFSENPFNPEQSIAHRFERIAALRPSQMALESDDKSLSYAELNSAGNRLAHRLLSHHGAPSDRVAVLMRHDSPLIAAVLGILKTGRIVVVLNPTDPPVRLRQVLDDAEPVLIITDSLNSAVANQIVKSGCKIIFFEEHSAES